MVKYAGVWYTFLLLRFLFYIFCARKFVIFSFSLYVFIFHHYKSFFNLCRLFFILFLVHIIFFFLIIGNLLFFIFNSFTINNDVTLLIWYYYSHDLDFIDVIHISINKIIMIERILTKLS